MSDPVPAPLDVLLDVLDLRYLGAARVHVEAEGGTELADESTRQLYQGVSQRQPHGRVFGGQVLAQCAVSYTHLDVYKRQGYGDEVIAYRLDGRSGALAVGVNLGASGVELPGGSTLLVASDPLVAGRLPTDTAAWVLLAEAP